VLQVFHLLEQARLAAKIRGVSQSPDERSADEQLRERRSAVVHLALRHDRYP
jgi:hypothetical protein